MKVFLDVGAHKGQTAKIVISPQYNFDRIVCFEPATECHQYIESIGDKRIEIYPFGLWKETKKAILFDAGNVGATIFNNKNGINSNKTTKIQLVKTSDWISNNIKSEDIVFMKLNCEGSEVDILDDLIDSGKILHLYSIKVDFDVRKIPSMRKREFEIRRKLYKNGIENVCFNYSFVINGDFELSITNWLDQTGANESLKLTTLREKYRSTLRKLSRKHRRFGRIREYSDYHFDGNYIYSLAKMIYRRIRNLYRNVNKI